MTTQTVEQYINQGGTIQKVPPKTKGKKKMKPQHETETVQKVRKPREPKQMSEARMNKLMARIKKCEKRAQTLQGKLDAVQDRWEKLAYKLNSGNRGNIVNYQFRDALC